MQQWRIKRPRGQLTLESEQAVLIEISGELLMDLVNLPQLTEEQLYYSGVAQGLMIAMSRHRGDPDSRQIAATFLESDQVTPSCISVLHLINGELRATMRSSSLHRLPSDLSFLAATAVAFGCSSLSVMINSLHLVLEEARG